MDRRLIPPTLYGRLLGADYAQLPRTVALLHARDGLRRYAGEVEVRRGGGLLSRLCARATRLPPAGDGPIAVEIDAAASRETWTRHVAGHRMRSRLRDHRGRLRETLGLVTFDFRLVRDGTRLRWDVDAVRLFGLRLPRRLFAGVVAHEYEEAGRYHFDVRATLPVAGLLVHYRGWLDVG